MRKIQANQRSLSKSGNKAKPCLQIRQEVSKIEKKMDLATFLKKSSGKDNLPPKQKLLKIKKKELSFNDFQQRIMQKVYKAIEQNNQQCFKTIQQQNKALKETIKAKDLELQQIKSQHQQQYALWEQAISLFDQNSQLMRENFIASVAKLSEQIRIRMNPFNDQ